MEQFEHNLQERLDQLHRQGLQRVLRPVQLADGYIQCSGKRYLNLAGNDYLGLGGSRELLRKFYADLTPATCFELYGLYGLGSGASRLMTGSHAQYHRLEEQLALLYKKDKALVFNSGYQINIGILPALAQKGDLILADKLCHASLIDGMRLTRARVLRYPHLDYDRLEQLLEKYSAGQTTDGKKTIFIVTESLFSMDGDCADLPTLIRLKEEYGAVLYVDEAHAVGVRGKEGLGLAEEQGVIDRIELLIGTFGKAWAGQGAFVACSRIIYEYLVNTARSLIFTTGLPPVSIHWLNFLLPMIRKMSAERWQLAALADRLRNRLRQAGLATGGESQIVPVIIGDDGKAVRVADQLQQQGFRVQAVRPPTVPHGTARLRLSVTAAMAQEQLDSLPRCIAQALSV
ncbi:MAG: aminotransferase class I/II-fold pyridoxal phosphate-dependent enzyme [Candidatus Electrothrix sp. YB6]